MLRHAGELACRKHGRRRNQLDWPGIRNHPDISMWSVRGSPLGNLVQLPANTFLSTSAPDFGRVVEDHV